MPAKALLAEFKDADLLIDRELMSDEEDLYDEYGVVEKKAVLCPSWRFDEVINFLWRSIYNIYTQCDSAVSNIYICNREIFFTKS